MTATKGGTMTAEEQRWKDKAEQAEWNWSNCSRACVHVQDERDKARAEVDRLTDDLQEYRNACEQKQEQIESAKDVIKSLTADLAKARGRGG